MYCGPGVVKWSHTAANRSSRPLFCRIHCLEVGVVVQTLVQARFSLEFGPMIMAVANL